MNPVEQLHSDKATLKFRYGWHKDRLSAHEKLLVLAYLDESFTLGSVAKELNVPAMKVKKQLDNAIGKLWR